MKSLKYIIFKEGKYYVSRCLNVEVSSFGKTIDEAKTNLKEALDLYFEDNVNIDIIDNGENNEKGTKVILRFKI